MWKLAFQRLIIIWCVPALGVCPQQRALSAEPVAAFGGICPLCEGHRAPHAGDLHPWSDQGLHHVSLGVRAHHSEVEWALSEVTVRSDERELMNTDYHIKSAIWKLFVRCNFTSSVRESSVPCLPSLYLSNWADCFWLQITSRLHYKRAGTHKSLSGRLTEISLAHVFLSLVNLNMQAFFLFFLFFYLIIQ